MTDLLHQLLLEEPDIQNEWRLKILDACGDLGQLLIDFSPVFALLIGEQPQVPAASPLESRHRFLRLLRNLLQLFCRPEHPMVLFIDDWQWADQSSLELLGQLMTEGDLRYLLVIAAYRDNEVPATHPFALVLRELKQLSVPISSQEVMPLTFDQTAEFIKDTLKPEVENFNGLAAIIHERTHGNPFFLHAFLEYIHEQGMLSFDPLENKWCWSGNRADTEAFPDDVVELFAKRFRNYEPSRQKLLFQAASLGNVFELAHLSLISGFTPERCYQWLEPEIRKQYLVPLPNGSKGGSAQPSQLQFAHDRVQQAAYGLIPEESRAWELLYLGNKLLNNLDSKAVNDQLFAITRHMNSGKHLLDSQAERISLLELNLQAARKAISATAFKAALEFHREAGELLTDPAIDSDLWNTQHDMVTALYLEWAETEFFEGDQDTAEKNIKTALEHARTPLEKAEVQRLMIVHYTLQARYPEAIEAGRDGLRTLGIFLPEKEYETYRDREIGLIRQNIRKQAVADFFVMPEMSHPEMRKATQLLISMGPPCYRSHQQLWSVLVPTVVNLILEYGNMPEAGYSHTALAGLLIWVGNDFDLARKFTDLSMDLMTKTFHSPSDRSVFYLMIGSSARHWFHHMSHCSRDYADAYEIGHRFGNLQYAAYAFGHDLYCRFFQGMPLLQLRNLAENYLNFSRTRYNQWAIDLIVGGSNIIDNLTSSAAAETQHAQWEHTYLTSLEEHHNIQVFCIYSIIHSFQLFVLGKHKQALEASNQANEVLYTVGAQGLLPWPEHLLIRFMLLSSLYTGKEPDVRAEWEAQMQAILQRLTVWAAHCPDNYGFKLELAKAEMARLQGNSGEAMVRYENAINAAQQGGFIQWQGVANERAALFWESRGLELNAVIYWQQAYNCYDAWDANRKTASLQQYFKERMLQALPRSQSQDDALYTRNIRDSFMAKGLELLQSRDLHHDEVEKRQLAEQQALELTMAMARLREEVAHRKEIEEALKEKERNLEEAQKLAQMGSWAFDITTQQPAWSSGMFNIWGIDPEQGAPSPYEYVNYIHPEDYPTFKATLREALDKGKPYHLEMRIQHQNGTKKSHQHDRRGGQRRTWRHSRPSRNTSGHHRTQAVRTVAAKSQDRCRHREQIQIHFSGQHEP